MNEMLDNKRLEELERWIEQAEEANAAARRDLANRRPRISPLTRWSIWVFVVLALVLGAAAASCGASLGRTNLCFPAGPWL